MAVKVQIVRIVHFGARTEAQASAQDGRNDLLVHVEILRPREMGGEHGVIRWIVRPRRRRVERLQQPCESAPVRERRPQRQYFLGGAWEELRLRDDDRSQALRDSQAVPRRADAEAVDETRTQ